MADVSPQAIAAARESLGTPVDLLPKSIAIIMDGNGRWARARDLPRFEGHLQGAHAVRKIITEGARLGLQAMTLYSFSIENWKRPADEVNLLMGIYASYLSSERSTMMDHNIQLRHFGRRKGLPDNVLKELDGTLEATSGNTGMFLGLALNYASRAEIVDSVKSIVQRVADGEIVADDIDEELIANSLSSAGVPDPDLVVRTSGELRLSNFLLWQISYAELYVTDVCWPDFDEQELHKAMLAYTDRNRRFGGVDESNK